MNLNWIRVLLINLIILIILISLAEFTHRLYFFITTGDSKALENPGLIKKDKYQGLYEYSNTLGYVTEKNANLVVDKVDGWNNILVTSNSLGVRNGNTKAINMNNVILAAGDSFVFGDQVNDDETWPAFLQKQGYNVFNLGVGGYGTAQSLRRLQLFIETYNLTPETVILQTLVGHDFKRDQLDFRSGFPSVSLHKNNAGNVEFYSPSEDAINIIGSKYNTIDKNAIILLSEYSYLAKEVFKVQVNLFQNRLMRKYIKSLPKSEIIDFTLIEFKKIPYNKFFVLQYANKKIKGMAAERDYLLNKLRELNIPYIDTYNSTRDQKGIMKDLYDGHHNKKGNKVIAETLINSGLLDN